MVPGLQNTALLARMSMYVRVNGRYFSGRRARRSTPTQMTAQENLLLRQKLKELQLTQAQPPRKPGFLDVIKDGVLHGIGWSFAQRMVDSIFGPRTINISDFTNHNNDVDSGNMNTLDGMCVRMT
ncbi:uncharacterized protein BXIN_1004 [Babesia sp. Xinjiang]|uniref:uncharacterized protein n=1 Tax=Babesia sp. Xinjiang TaxID=462227 RepID=UPI000A25FD7C|nr:uncharacterized protein BXIN_1004 [Babesia sp. Xinjiang]ORM42212.1 hypothetical protein BXIN_1004 [Babesia sp. Xinjiang]